MSRNQQININFPVVVRYDTLVFFENFYEYYNYMFGEMELNVKLSPAALVWYCVDPKYSLANGVETSTLEPVMLNIGPAGSEVPTDISATLLKQCSENVGLKSIADVYSKRFTQIGSWGRAVINFMVNSPETINTSSLGNFVQTCMSGHKEIRIRSIECIVNLCESHITGFNIKDSLKQGFVNLFAGKPTVIPCEKYDYMYFGGHYNSSGIDTTVTMNFVNAKAVIILCPRRINGITCYQNPMLNEG
jgi:hypothetical protein